MAMRKYVWLFRLENKVLVFGRGERAAEYAEQQGLKAKKRQSGVYELRVYNDDLGADITVGTIKKEPIR